MPTSKRTKDSPIEIGQRLKAAIDDVPGMTGASLAKEIDVSKAAVYQWINGSTKNMRPTNLFRAADALKINPRWLITGEGERTAVKPGGADERRHDFAPDVFAIATLYNELHRSLKVQVRSFLAMAVQLRRLGYEISMEPDDRADDFYKTLEKHYDNLPKLERRSRSKRTS